ncbi:hypothetical protein [Burkholderia pseudomallei]|uniref:hypothetical protein n=1 Tax=Burkholderia pseudomallei TaxID=28450 RepID=UPI000537149A|nr:hypothetical protein [Burkholderia pseudomallei]KGV23987.1 hypothetical protein X894_1245 [Burkholderia pseudomallei MSHR4462]MXK57952.1 hypothetical protein [Burkholderia pseudomallei]MXN57413.1 hypothetical protein [Burkholderia pseudomallei]CAJ2884177.1 Uncharacterised protein [Burkholderia pseudomallei]CAJ5576924.1 Uncharacterised protein [Burkholderia pseudomallei]
MLARLRALVGGRKPTVAQASDELPAEVATVIAAATVMDRGADDEGNPRVLVMTAHGTFRYSLEGARAWMKQVWPSLTEAQTARAVKLLASRVTEFKHTVKASAANTQRSAWRDWKPLEF